MNAVLLSASCPHCDTMLTKREQRRSHCPVCRRSLSATRPVGDRSTGSRAWTFAFLITLLHGLIYLGAAIFVQQTHTDSSGATRMATVGCLLAAISTVLLYRNQIGVILLAGLAIAQTLHVILLVVALGPRRELLQPGLPLERLIWNDPPQLIVAAVVSSVLLLAYLLVLTSIISARRER